jgi:tol-pal system protein YbgF
VRYREVIWFAAAVLAGAVGASLVGPRPAEAVAREIVALQQDVTLLLQGQRDMQTSIDQNQAVLKTLIEQSTDAVNKMSASMSGLQKSVLDVQANSGSRMDTMSTQVQGLSDNLEEIKARIGKLNQQLTDLQNTVQSLDAKLSPGATSAPPSDMSGKSSPTSSAARPASLPSADILYANALRDITSGKYDLAKQEFQDYLKYYPQTDLASNAQFYLGEISYARKDYADAVVQYDDVLRNYPDSFKLVTARYKKGMALLALGQKSAAIRELREVILRYPGTDEAKRSRATLHQLGVAVTTSTR